MRLISRRLAAGMACWLAVCGSPLVVCTPAWAQLPQPRLYSVFPSGVQKGVPTDVALANGADLEETTALLFSHPGIKADRKVNMADGQPVANTFVVSVDPSVPVGVYEVRSIGKYGISNPRSFVVGDRPEIQEVEPNNTRDVATKVELNSLVNARSNGATDIDWYKVALKQGQRTLIECVSGQIDSRMDGVLELYSPTGKLLMVRRDKFAGPKVDFTPSADGEYLIKVYDSSYGGSADHFYRMAVHTGPHIDFILPPSGLPNTTGEYVVYGRNLPGGQPSDIKVGGQALEQLKVQITLPENPTVQNPALSLRPSEATVDGISYTLASPNGTSNPVMVYFATANTVREVEPNSTPATAQAITVPSEYVGQFQERGDVDFVTFEAKAAQVYWLEVFGERNGGTVDPFLTLDQVTVNDKGVEVVNRIAALDESTPNLRPLVFDTNSNDPAYRFQVPADGKYRVSVRDRYYESRGGPQMVYRLAIRPEKPDFRIAALPVAPKPQDQLQIGDPWELVLRKGDNTLVEVYGFRLDGFSGEIDITATGLPEGVTYRPATIGPGQNSTTLVFTSTENAAPWTGPIQIIGTAQIPDSSAAAGTPPKSVAHAARGGTIVWNRGQGVSTIARMTRDLVLSVIPESAPYQVLADVPAEIEVNQGSQILLPVKVAKRNGFDDVINFTFVGQPANVQLEAKPVNKGQSEELAKLFVQNNAPPGTYTVFLKSQATIPYRRNVEAADAAQKEKEATDKLLAEVTEQNKKAVDEKPVKDKAMVDADAAAKAAADAKVAADKLATDTAAAAQQALANKDNAVKLAAATDAAAKAATAAAAAAKDAAAKDPNNAEFKTALAAAEKAATDAVNLAKQAADAKDVAEKASVAADAEAKKAAEAKVLADKAATDTAAMAKLAADEKAASDKLVADLAKKLADVTAAKAAADKKATDTAAASKPNNVVVYPPSTPVVITVKTGAANLAVAPQNGGAIKRGEKIEVKVTVTRVNGFMGPVELSLKLPPNVTGLTAEPVTVPADKNEGVLIVQASGEATEGQLANLVVHGSMEFNGKAGVDQPITINVSK